MPDNRSWIGQRFHNFAEGWRQHPFQHAISTVAGALGGPVAGRGLQAGFDAYNRGQDRNTGERGRQLGQAMQDALNQRIYQQWQTPQGHTTDFGPWAGGYRGASMPQQPTPDNIASTLGVPDYAGNTVPNSPAQVQPQQPRPQASGYHGPGMSTGGGVGFGWQTADMGTLMDALNFAGGLGANTGNFGTYQARFRSPEK